MWLGSYHPGLMLRVVQGNEGVKSEFAGQAFGEDKALA